jgi:hypothetical protein
MPLRLDATAEEDKQAQAADVAIDSLETHNPLALSPRARSFCELVTALTQNNTRTLTQDEFAQLAEEYDKLEGVERFAAATELAKKGITWLQTLEDNTDGYDDELNGYDVYAKICAAAAEAATEAGG